MSFYDAIRVGASGASGDLEIQRSLRFNSDDTAYLNRTPSSAGNRKTWTWSAWIKRANIGSRQILFSADNNATHATYFMLELQADDNLRALAGQETGSATCVKETSMVLRDTGAWYHIVFKFDATNATAVFYVNGQEITDYSSTTNPSNQNFQVNATTQHFLGRFGSSLGTSPFDGYMAEVNFIDGQALDSSYFGETNPVTGQWNPKKFSGGSYGTNGFRLTFEDNSNNAALGTDTSGNGNTFTVNNLSSSHDTLIDTPSNNFCVFNELNRTNDANLTDGNLIFVQSSNDESVTGTFGIDSGKWYWEVYKKSSENPELGIDTNQRVLSNKTDDVSPTKVCFRTNGGDQQVGTGTPTSITGSSGGQTGAGVIRIAVDFDNKKIWYSDLSGNFFNSGNPATGSNAAFDFSSVAVANGCVPYFFCGTGANDSIFVNFGADSAFGGALTGSEVQSNTDGNGNGLFKYAVPSGYLALCSANLPDPTIPLPNQQFNTLLYTGNGGTQSITGLNFAPDWVWTKERSVSGSHQLYDAVRGATNRLESNNDGDEDVISNGLTSFDSNGFSIGSHSAINENGVTHVAWNWNAGGTDGKTYAVTVVSDSGNKYRFDGFGTSAVTLDLAEGGTYIFDQSDSSNAGHPLRFSTTSNGTHGGGSEYTTGVTTAGTPGSSGAYTQIVVAASAPTLYYYCSVHSGMGGQANTNSTLGSSNFDGTLQATVKANPTAGFSIVSYTVSNISGMTMGHGLGVAPVVAISKKRSGTSDWSVQFINKSDNSTDYAFLNKTDAAGDTSTYFTSTTVKDGFGSGSNGSTIIQYVFSEVAGYSKFGSYTPNQNDNGPFVFTGFRPAWILLKSVGNIYGGGSPFSGNWYILDTKRSTFNVAAATLATASNNAEDTAWGAEGIMDILSNGFKIRTDSLSINATLSGAFIYLAFAESPFKNSRAR
tara:strand:- start:195 stop:3005 length:2811 start_codon:yes stop_codon:yes gene_type:complete